MIEYIERKALKEAFKSVTDDCTCPIHLAAEIDQILDQSPVADVAPVRLAKWEVVVGSDDKEHMVCTGCRKQQDLTGVFAYCPNCGAKMDGE